MAKSQMTRVTLIERVKDGKDEKSWEEFVTIYKQYLYTVVRNMQLSHHDTEEILQDVFVKVWDKLADFQYYPKKGRFRFWLCTIAKNTVVDYIRRQRADIERLDKIESGERENYLSRISVPEIDSIAEKEWQNFVANLALKNVTESRGAKEVECFSLFVKGKAITEIAKILGLSENSVYIYKARVQELLRKEIKFLEEELG